MQRILGTQLAVGSNRKKKEESNTENVPVALLTLNPTAVHEALPAVEKWLVGLGIFWYTHSMARFSFY